MELPRLVVLVPLVIVIHEGVNDPPGTWIVVAEEKKAKRDDTGVKVEGVLIIRNAGLSLRLWQDSALHLMPHSILTFWAAHWNKRVQKSHQSKKRLFCFICTWPPALGAWSEALGGQAVEAGQLGLGDHGTQHRGLVPEDDRALDIWSKHYYYWLAFTDRERGRDMGNRINLNICKCNLTFSISRVATRYLPDFSSCSTWNISHKIFFIWMDSPLKGAHSPWPAPQWGSSWVGQSQASSHFRHREISSWSPQ